MMVNTMRVVGYSDPISVRPGETIRFMVSSEAPTYRVDMVRLIHGDDNPRVRDLRRKSYQLRSLGNTLGVCRPCGWALM